MKISYNWLRRYLQTDIPLSQIEEILTAIGLEVESVAEVEQIAGSLTGVVTGEVLECSKHPGADMLSLTKVDVGSGEPLAIVCGAPNVAKGQKVLVATVGTLLTSSKGDVLKIKRSKIRGEESMGMICAEDELGLGDSHEGIMVLPQETPVGVSAKEYLKLESDVVFEIGLTPNRIDAASHIGVARDLYAYLKFNNIESTFASPLVEEYSQLPKSSQRGATQLEVLSPDGAPKYHGLTLDNIVVAPSPHWLQNSLKAIGLRPINNVVDITNFVLHETGHPLHAFDNDKIEGKKVVVRRAAKGEKFVTLDGVERTLSEEDLMICDSVNPMCIAGVFGGDKSGVSNSTSSIFLESAYFNPVSIRRSSKRHTLKTDASFRYERGANPDNVEYALKRAAILLCEIAGAKLCGEVATFEEGIAPKAVISVNFKSIVKQIGKDIGTENIIKILRLLEFEILSNDTQEVMVSVPRYRVDVTRECDVVEEILRIYGYNNVELPQRVSSSLSSGAKPEPDSVRSIAANLLANNGFYEAMNNSLTRGDYYTNLKTFPKERLVMVLNPLSSDLNAMRQTLLLNGLEMVAYNINRQNGNLKLFEFGNVYSYLPSEGDKLNSYKESLRLSLFVTGQEQNYWRGKRPAGNYFLMKGYVEALLKRFGLDIDDFEFEQAPSDLFSEGLTLYKRGSMRSERGDKDNERGGKGAKIGVMGTIRKELAKEFDVKQALYAAELNWDLIHGEISKQKIIYTEMPKFPSVTRDMALLLDEEVSYWQIRKRAFELERKLLKSVVLFDVYRGEKIPKDKKQYALSFTLQDYSKTLTDKRVEDVMNRLLDSFIKEFGATLR